jgi:hypothetical protein
MKKYRHLYSHENIEVYSCDGYEGMIAIDGEFLLRLPSFKEVFGEEIGDDYGI